MPVMPALATIVRLKLGWWALRLAGRQIWAGAVRTQLEASKEPSLQGWFSAKPARNADQAERRA